MDYDVVEAYWIGNEILDSFSDDNMKQIITSLTARGLPKSIGNELIEKIPSDCFPHHDFNVFYVGVGRITGSVKVTTQNMENCRVSWGRVTNILSNKPLLVITNYLKNKNDKLYLGKAEPKTVAYKKEWLSNVKAGDLVALHWGFAPMLLTGEQVKRLQGYQERMIKIMNG